MGTSGGAGRVRELLVEDVSRKGSREAILIARPAGVPLKTAAKLREPSEQAYFESEVKPLLSRCGYLGELGGHDKPALLGGSLALVNPMQWAEPFGLVMI